MRGHAATDRPITVSGRAREPLPATVEGLIASRLDALTPDEDLVLKGASVLGDQFRTELLRNMFVDGRLGQDLATTLASLVRNELIVEASTHRGAYAFRHSLIRQGACEQLTAAQRQSLHAAAAAAIEQRYSNDVSAYVGRAVPHDRSQRGVQERLHDRAGRFLRMRPARSAAPAPRIARQWFESVPLGAHSIRLPVPIKS